MEAILKTNPATARFIPWPLRDLEPYSRTCLKNCRQSTICLLPKQVSITKANTRLAEDRLQHSGPELRSCTRLTLL